MKMDASTPANILVNEYRVGSFKALLKRLKLSPEDSKVLTFYHEYTEASSYNKGYEAGKNDLREKFKNLMKIE